MIFIFFSIFFVVVTQKFCFCIVPQPISLMDEIRDIKKSVSYLEEKTKTIDNDSIPSLNTLLTTMDVNVKSLQEKAHFWDTFRLKVSIWNEQLSGLDRKLDVLNKAQRKIDDLDSNLNDLLNSMAKKIDDISSKTSLIEESIKEINNKLDDKKQDRSLVEEFTSKGILYTIKQLDKKIDKIQLNSFQRNETCLKLNEVDYSNNNNSNNILKDISLKVNVIFDKLSEKDDLIQEEGFNATYKSIENVENQNYSYSCLKKILNRLDIPIKKAGKVLKHVLNKINKVENDTETLKRILEKNNFNVQNVLSDNFESQNVSSKNMSKLIANCSKSKEITEKTEFDYTFCTTSQHLKGVYSFNTTLIKDNATKYWKERTCREGWLVIQNREVFNVQENFNRSWNDYKHGFGEVDKEYWIGNDFLHELSHKNDLRLRIELETFQSVRGWAEYDVFKVGSECEMYQLTVKDYNDKGTIPDSFSSHNNSTFSTFDKNDDISPSNNKPRPCPRQYVGGWWLTKCTCLNAHLNGAYFKWPIRYSGIAWESWMGNVAIKKSIMMVKSKGNLKKINDLTLKPILLFLYYNKNTS